MRNLKRALSLVLAVVMVIGVAEYTWYYPRNMFTYWFLFGVIGACVKLTHLERSRHTA